MLSFIKNAAVVVGTLTLGLCITAGLVAIGLPPIVGGTVGGAVYIGLLLKNVSE